MSEVFSIDFHNSFYFIHFLKSPVSTKIQVSCLPIALFIKAAATEESTPPDRPKITFLSPTVFFYFLNSIFYVVTHRPIFLARIH